MADEPVLVVETLAVVRLGREVPRDLETADVLLIHEISISCGLSVLPVSCGKDIRCWQNFARM